jgi:hypothetical protein
MPRVGMAEVQKKQLRALELTWAGKGAGRWKATPPTTGTIAPSTRGISRCRPQPCRRFEQTVERQVEARRAR